MKFMKLGNRPDTFYTEEATRTVISDVPSDLTIRINDITFLLHKYPLLRKCGLLQRLCSDSDNPNLVTLNLDGIPGGDEAFDICTKFCYGITINLGGHNYASAFCAAKFLNMTEAVESGNFITKLEIFFSSCILEGWKDPILTLQNTRNVYEWSENLGIVRRCIESIADKILTPPAKVAWSYTYTRSRYRNRQHRSTPKDWWTEDISFLDIDSFRCIIFIIKSMNSIQPQLIGEALHVYACRWLLETTQCMPQDCSTSNHQAEEEEEHSDRKRKILETVVGLIPSDKGSVSIKFLLKLLSLASDLAVSLGTKAELLRLSGIQFEEVELGDLMVLGNDVDLVKAVLESFLRQWKRQRAEDDGERLSLRRSVCKVGKVIDSYLQMVAKEADIPLRKVVSLAETLPGFARPNHDDLYMAIDVYLKVHPDISKVDKKHLCRVLDCQKLSAEMRAHAVRNERLPLRTVVQILFFERETSSMEKGSKKEMSLSSEKHQKCRENKGELRPEPSFRIGDGMTEKGKEIRDERGVGIQLSSSEKALIRRISERRQR